MICRHEGACGGCGLQSLAYAEQVARKARSLRDRLPIGAAPDPDGLFVPVFEPRATGGGPWHFRQKVAFVFGRAAGRTGLVMGHFARGSQTVIAVDDCPVHSARGNRIAFALRDRLAAAGIEAWRASPSGVLRHLIVRSSRDDREAVAMLVVARNDRRLRAPIRGLLASADRPDGFYVNVHDGPGPYLVGPETLHLAGLRRIREAVGGFSFLVSPEAFFQTNVAAAEALQALVVEWAAGHVPLRGARILDLYAGSGLFSLPLVGGGATVVAVEENRAAAEDAETNRRLNRLPAGRFRMLASRVEDALGRLARDAWDVVILDPPRQGCPDAVLASVFDRLAPPRVIYVSCNPDALAAELPMMVSKGYRLDAVRAVDMFPHTDHVETVVSLGRR